MSCLKPLADFGADQGRVGEKGQPGATMQLADHPDRLVRHVPARCRCCGEALDGAGEARAERRQVTEIPQVRPVDTEHQAVELCGGCGQVTKGEFPDGVTAPVQYGPRLMGTGVYLWHGQFLSREGWTNWRDGQDTSDRAVLAVTPAWPQLP